MKEYIEREAVRTAYKKSLENNTHKKQGASAIHIQEHNHILHIIDKLPTADVISKEHYDDLYSKYCDLAKILNDKLPPIVKMVNNADVVKVVRCKDCDGCDKIGTKRCTEELTDCRAKVITRPPQSWCYVESEVAE